MKPHPKPAVLKLQPAVWFFLFLVTSSVLLLIFGPPFRKSPSRNSEPAITPAKEYKPGDYKKKTKTHQLAAAPVIVTEANPIQASPVQPQADGSIIVTDKGASFRAAPVSTNRVFLSEAEVRAAQGKKRQ